MSDSKPSVKQKGPQSSRPLMKGYGISANEEGMLSWAWVDEQLLKARNYWIGTTRPDGKPHVAPVWGVWMDGVLYFGSGSSSRKSRNLAVNPAIVVNLESGDEVVILEGVAELLMKPDATFFAQLADKYEEKYNYHPDYPTEENCYYAVRPRIAFAWFEKDFPNTATRWQFEGQ